MIESVLEKGMRHQKKAGYKNHLINTDIGPDLKALVLMVLQNIDNYDKRPEQSELEKKLGVPNLTPREQFTEWLTKQDESTRKLVKTCPPNKLYRLKGGLQSATRGTAPFGVVISYKHSRGAGFVGVQVLGFEGEELGSAKNPLPLPTDVLEDITEEARRLAAPEIFVP